MYRARFQNKGNPFVFRTLVWLETLSCRLATHVIATNQSYKTIEMERGSIPEERITIVRNGPDLNDLWTSKPDQNLRQPDKSIIAYAGVMGFQDGLDYLIRALHLLKTELGRSDFYCFLIGGHGDAQPSLKKLTTQLGLDNHIHFTGWVSDADYVRYLSSADICVDPDPSNPFNDRSTMNKIMEYMALEKPIVAFDLPEHRVSAQAAALYVRPNDELEFARTLVQLMGDPERRRDMGLLGRRRIETELAWQYSIPPLLEAYRKIFDH
jgi:glycosyltransferase involved in cell wall biosynthesis